MECDSVCVHGCHTLFRRHCVAWTIRCKRTEYLSLTVACLPLFKEMDGVDKGSRNEWRINMRSWTVIQLAQRHFLMPQRLLRNLKRLLFLSCFNLNARETKWNRWPSIVLLATATDIQYIHPRNMTLQLKILLVLCFHMLPDRPASFEYHLLALLLSAANGVLLIYRDQCFFVSSLYSERRCSSRAPLER